MFFTVVILLLLWLCLFVFLKSYYEGMKTREILKSAMTIKNNYSKDNFDNTLESLAFKNNMCIVVTDKYNNLQYSYEMMAGRCLIHGNHGANIYRLQNKIVDSDSNEIFYSLNDSQTGTKMLIYGFLIGSKDNVKGYVYLNTMLEPIDSSAAIIKRQLMYITLIILILAFVISLFISKKISKPIAGITKSAQKFAKRDYATKFSGGEYLETQQLADVLNYAGKEISKVDGLRRDLISNISHDLRTPLTIIKSYAEMIRDLSGDNPVKRNDHVNVIIDESDRLTSLVNGLLELSKLESGNAELNHTTFSINGKIEEILQRYEIYTERDGYEFLYEADEDVIVSADIPKIEQVMYNLINNAVNYTGDDKKITIKQINKESSVRIEIIDNGKGIEQEMLPLIFDRYYRDKKNARETAGTGLGLSIVKEILKLHGYPFGVSSEIDKGSTFWFEIKRV